MNTYNNRPSSSSNHLASVRSQITRSLMNSNNKCKSGNLYGNHHHMVVGAGVGGVGLNNNLYYSSHPSSSFIHHPTQQQYNINNSSKTILYNTTASASAALLFPLGSASAEQLQLPIRSNDIQNQAKFNNNVQYGTNYFANRRKSMSNFSSENRKRNQIPSTTTTTTDWYQSTTPTTTTTSQLHPCQSRVITPSTENIPTSTTTHNSSNSAKGMITPLPLTSLPIENIVVRVPTARKKFEKSSSTSVLPPPSSTTDVYGASSLFSQSSSSTANSNYCSTGDVEFPSQSHRTVTSHAANNTSQNGSSLNSRRGKQLKPYSFNVNNLLMNETRRSTTPTPILKKKSVKHPTRDQPSERKTTLKQPKTPTNNGNNGSGMLTETLNKKKSCDSGGVLTISEKTSKEPSTPTTIKVPNLLRSIVDLNKSRKQAKIEILTLEDYMLDSPSSRTSKGWEEETSPPPKHKLLAILMDINIRYTTHVSNKNHPNYNLYSQDNEVEATLRERRTVLVETRYGKILSPVNDCGIQFEGEYFGKYSFVFNIDTNYFGCQSWTLILRAFIENDSTTLCVFGETSCWFTVDINNIKMNNQEFQRTIGGMKLGEWNEIFISLNMAQQQNESNSVRQILVWANGVQTVIPINPETTLKVKPGENKSLHFMNMLNGKSFKGTLSSIILLNKPSESMNDLVRSGKSFLKNHEKPIEKPINLVTPRVVESPPP